MEEHQFMEYVYKHRYLLIALGTSLVGAIVRISNDKEVSDLSKGKRIGYYFSALATGYLFLEILKLQEWERFTGLVCMVAGMISGNIINFIIIDLPKMMPQILTKYINKHLGIDPEFKDVPNNNFKQNDDELE